MKLNLAAAAVAAIAVTACGAKAKKSDTKGQPPVTAPTDEAPANDSETPADESTTIDDPSKDDGKEDGNGDNDLIGAADRLLGTDRQAAFDFFVDAIAGIEDTARLEPALARLGTSWETELAKTRERFLAARTAVDVYYALTSLNRSYHDAHSNINAGLEAIAPAEAEATLPLLARVEYTDDGHHYIIEGDGIAPGSILKRFAGLSVDEVEAAVREWAPFHSPYALHQDAELWLSWRYSLNTPLPRDGDAVEIELIDPDTAAAYSVTLHWQVQATASGLRLQDATACGGDYSAAAADYETRQPEKIGLNYCVYPTADAAHKLVRFFSFNYGDSHPQDPDGEQDTAGLVAYLRTHNVTHVVFDVRENSGGGLMMDYFVALLTNQPFKTELVSFTYGRYFKDDPARIHEVDFFQLADVDRLVSYLDQEPEAVASPPYPFHCPDQNQACVEGEETVVPPTDSPSFQMAVLAGPSTFSDGNEFVEVLARNQLATLIGVPASGGDGAPRLSKQLRWHDLNLEWEFSAGRSYVIGSREQLLEGSPAEPDIRLFPNAANRGRYLDDALDKLGWP